MLDNAISDAKATLEACGFRASHEKKWLEFFTEVVGVLHKKSHGYGEAYKADSVERCLLFGAIRMRDKCDRIINLALNKMTGRAVQEHDERIGDTLMDIAGYAGLLGAYWEEAKDE